VEQEMLEGMKQAWQGRVESERREERERRRCALERATAAAKYVKEQYPECKVYLYGSLIWGKHFTPRSDIDLMIRGFPSEVSYWRLLVEMERCASPFEISVVLEEDACSSLKEKVLAGGKEL
jgi:predicted nucleotidyltransferase